jgi:hypothetical protein
VKDRSESQEDIPGLPGDGHSPSEPAGEIEERAKVTLQLIAIGRTLLEEQSLSHLESF